MKVHFASGTHPFPRPWLNVDYAPGADVEVDLLEPFPANLASIEHAYVGHFLEHLTPEEGIGFLVRVRERMTPDGLLVVVGPDAEKTRAWHARGLVPDALLEAVLAHGTIPEDDPHNRGNVHLWDCTGAAVVGMLAAAGWSGAREFPLGDLARHAPGTPMIDPAGWQFAALAYAGTDDTTAPTPSD